MCEEERVTELTTKDHIIRKWRIPKERAKKRLLQAWLHLWEIVDTFQGTPGIISMLYRFEKCMTLTLVDIIGEEGIPDIFCMLPKGYRTSVTNLRNFFRNKFKEKFIGKERFPRAIKLATEFNLLPMILAELEKRCIGRRRLMYTQRDEENKAEACKQSKNKIAKRKKISKRVAKALNDLLYQT